MSCVCNDDLLDSLIQTIGAVRHHEGGSAGNHSVIIIKEVLLHGGKLESIKTQAHADARLNK